MPELPEVEVLRRELLPLLEGKEITRVVIRDSRIVLPERRIVKETIVGVERWGKYLLLVFQEGDCLAFHLGMTGQLLVGERSIPHKHERVRFGLSSGEYLLFDDPRKFGKVLHFEEKEGLTASLGIDPFSPAYTFENFEVLCQGKKRLKDFLLDQRKVCGIGNIYASEILFRACLHPERRLSTLSEEEKRRLFETILQVLEEATEHKGTTIRDFRRSSGEEGNFQNFLLVYGKTKCPRCGGDICRIVIASRSTYFCPRCQK